jgi:hypothetical protein
VHCTGGSDDVPGLLSVLLCYISCAECTVNSAHGTVTRHVGRDLRQHSALGRNGSAVQEVSTGWLSMLACCSAAGAGCLWVLKPGVPLVSLCTHVPCSSHAACLIRALSHKARGDSAVQHVVLHRQLWRCQLSSTTHLSGSKAPCETSAVPRRTARAWVGALPVRQHCSALKSRASPASILIVR